MNSVSSLLKRADEVPRRPQPIHVCYVSHNSTISFGSRFAGSRFAATNLLIRMKG